MKTWWGRNISCTVLAPCVSPTVLGGSDHLLRLSIVKHISATTLCVILNQQAPGRVCSAFKPWSRA